MNNVRVTVVWIDQPDEPYKRPIVRRTSHMVAIPLTQQFVQLKVNGKPIVVITPKSEFAEHPNGGSMIPVAAGLPMTLVAGRARPHNSTIEFVPMTHKSGRLAVIKPNQRSFVLV